MLCGETKAVITSPTRRNSTQLNWPVQWPQRIGRCGHWTGLLSWVGSDDVITEYKSTARWKMYKIYSNPQQSTTLAFCSRTRVFSRIVASTDLALRTCPAIWSPRPTPVHSRDSDRQKQEVKTRVDKIVYAFYYIIKVVTKRSLMNNPISFITGLAAS